MRSFRLGIFVFALARALTLHAQTGRTIASAELPIAGSSLELTQTAVTATVDFPVTIGTKFAGLSGDQAPFVPGLAAVGDLTGPGLDEPIRLTTIPGQPFDIPALHEEGVYFLQNVRLMREGEFAGSASPSLAVVTVARTLVTNISVRQLTPEELRARGITVDGRNYDVYEYTFSILIGGEIVQIPFPVIVDPRTHEIIPVRSEKPFGLPPVGQLQPPRWTPPSVIPISLEVDDSLPPPEELERNPRARPSV